MVRESLHVGGTRPTSVDLLRQEHDHGVRWSMGVHDSACIQLLPSGDKRCASALRSRSQQVDPSGSCMTADGAAHSSEANDWHRWIVSSGGA